MQIMALYRNGLFEICCECNWLFWNKQTFLTNFLTNNKKVVCTTEYFFDCPVDFSSRLRSDI